jgi:hypothetical protein
MVVAAASAAVTPPTSIPQSSAAPAPGAEATANGPADSVSLSPAAQQVLAGAAPPAQDASSRVEIAAPSVTQAVAALNDTTGETTLIDQLKAYAQLVTLVSNGQVVSDKAAPSAGTIGVGAASAVIDSPFAQRVTQVLDTPGLTREWQDNASDTANAVDRVRAAFQALSADDQQIFVAAKGLNEQLASQAPPITTADGFLANQQAQADALRALQAAMNNPAYHTQIQTNAMGGQNNWIGQRDAMLPLAQAAGDQATVDLIQLTRTLPETDAWTQSVQAYFAKYGPPPPPSPDTGVPNAPQPQALQPQAGYQTPDAGTLMDALAKLDDKTGAVSNADQLSAYNLIEAYLRDPDAMGLGRMAVISNWGSSPFMMHSSNVADSVTAGVTPDDNVFQQMLDRLNRLSADDQQTYFDLDHAQPDGTVMFASLDSLKANLSMRDTMRKLYSSITAQYGVDDLSKVTDPASLKNPVLTQLQSLYWTDQMSDDWTTQAQAFLASLKPGDLGAGEASAPSPKDVASAKAMETLKQVSAQQQKWIDAAKAEREGKTVQNASDVASPDSQVPRAVGEALDTYA